MSEPPTSAAGSPAAVASPAGFGEPEPFSAPGPVVIGFDGSDSGADALDLGVRCARVLGVRALVTVVYPAPAPLSAARVDAEWVADRRRAATETVDRARALLTAQAGTPGVEVAYRVVPSTSAAHGLHDLAEEEGASVIVVGSATGPGPERRLFAGSTASRLLSGAACPVAVAPPRGHNRTELTRIGVAYVETQEARAALRAAARLAQRTSAALRLYTVVHDDTAAKPFLIGSDAEYAFSATAREAATRALEAAVASLPAGLDVRAQVLGGDVVTALSDLDEGDVDVLFCGSRGYGPVRRVLLGGVSSRLLRQARSPVIVVPRGG
jgi:nucleotide-binding universal stress UspA family protein